MAMKRNRSMRLALLTLACCSKTLDVRTSVISACDQPDAVAQATEFTLRVEGAGLDTARETTVKADAGVIALGAIPPTQDGKVTLYDQQQALAGGIGSLDLSGTKSSSPVNIRLVIGRIGTFIQTTVSGSPPTCSLIQHGRQGHTATRLDDGTVLIVGGEQTDNGVKQVMQSVELYDPNTGVFTEQAPLQEGRAYHTATLTEDGKQVLVCGGQGALGGRPVALATCVVFDTASRKFNGTSIALNAGRQQHTATVLSDGRIVLIGGAGTGGDFLTSTEFYDPKTPTARLVAGPELSHARMQHTATLLGDGASILVAGGRTRTTVITNAEVWQPDAVKSAGTGLGRFAHAAVRFSDGRVLLAGGFTSVNDEGNPPVTDAIEIFDTTLGCSETLALSSPRADLTVSPLPAVVGRDPAVLFVGGVTASGVPSRDADTVTLGRQRACGSVTVSPTPAKMKQPRTRATAVQLSGGDVLVVGGSQSTGSAVIAADAGEIFVSPR